MEWNSNSIGALLIFMGLGIMFYLWIGVISPNRDTQNIWSLVTTIFWIQLQDYSPFIWVGLDEFKFFLFSTSVLVVVSAPIQIFSFDINIFFYSSIALVLAGAISALAGAR